MARCRSLYADAHHLSRLLVRGEPDVAARRRELHRIIQDVRKDLHEHAYPHRHESALKHVQFLVRGCRERHDGFDSVSPSGARVRAVPTQVDLVGRDPGHIQEVIDEPCGRRTCRSSTVGACRTRRRRAGLETLDGEPNRCERVSEFVRKRREKFVFTLIRFHELGGSVTHAEFQFSIQGFSVVLAVWRFSMSS